MTATTWRDLADQLDACQIATLAQREDECTREFSLDTARGWAADNLLQGFYADVPEPADATDVSPWCEAADGTVERLFSGTERVITSTVSVRIDGGQSSDGRVTARRAHVHVSNQGFDPGSLDEDGLRRLAAACIAAADEIRRLSTAG